MSTMPTMPTIEERIDDIILNTEEKGLSICRNGNDFKYMSKYPETCRDFNINRIERALVEIPMLITKSSSYRRNALSSYGLKHELSDFCQNILYKKTNCQDDPYISNGDFIIALLLLGYKMKFPKGANGLTSINSNIQYKFLKVEN